MKILKIISVGVLIFILKEAKSEGLDFLLFSPYSKESAMGKISLFKAYDKTSLYFSYMNLFPDLKEVNMHYAVFKSSYKNLYFGIIYLNSGKHPITEYDPFTETVKEKGHFSTYDIAYVFNVSKTYKNLLTEAGIKFLKVNLFYKGSGLAFDLRAKYSLSSFIKFLAEINNLGADISLNKKYSIKLPTYLQAGAGVDFEILKLGSQIGYYLHEKIYTTKIGVETQVIPDIFSLRMGYFNEGKQLKGVTFGLGIKIKNITLDYANLPQGSLWQAGRINQYSFRVSL